MKKILTIMIMLIALHANATTYYVAASGNNTNNGTSPNTPWSFDHLNKRWLTPGDSVLFKAGDTFFGSIFGSRVNSSNITWGTYGSGAQPVITGMKTISDWTKYSGNIYYAKLPSVPMLNMVTIDGTVTAMGRYPRSGYNIYLAANKNTSITSSTKLPFNATGAEVVIRKYLYILDRHIITAISGNEINYSATNEYGNNSNPPTVGNGYFIQNCIETLTYDGAWYYDLSTGRLYVYFESGPAKHVIKASDADVNVLNSNNSGWSFNGITFDGANIYGIDMTGTSNTKFTNCNFTNQGGDAFHLEYNTNFSISGCNISNSLNCGIIQDIGGNVLKVHNTTLTNIGIIQGAGRSGTGSQEGISNYGTTGFYVDSCTLNNIGYNAIDFNGNNVRVAKNHINNFCIVKDDGGGIYSYNSGSQVKAITNSNRVITDNVITNGIGAYDGGVNAYNYAPFGEAHGIYMDDFCNNTLITNNYIYTGDAIGIFSHNNTNITISDNVVGNFKGGQIGLDEDAVKGDERNNTIKDNTLIAVSGKQPTLFISMNFDDNPALFAKWNNNIYARPIADNTTIVIDPTYPGHYPQKFYTLAQWQAFSGQDLNSRKSAVKVSASSSFGFIYNYSGASISQSLPGKYVDVANTSYSKSITLPAYTGKVLISNTKAILDKNIILTGTKTQAKVHKSHK